MGKIEFATISIEDISKEIRQVMSEFKEEILSILNHKEFKLMTRKQVSEFFSVDISTVNNWTNKEILNPVMIEGRRYFDINDLKDLIEKSKLYKKQDK